MVGICVIEVVILFYQVHKTWYFSIEKFEKVCMATFCYEFCRSGIKKPYSQNTIIWGVKAHKYAYVNTI